MHLHTLETFITILDEGSLVRASERLHVSQSTVTARLKTLEGEVGQQLLHRDKSGVTPTAAGLRLARSAETMMGLWRQARLETQLPNSVTSVCNIGCHPDLWPGRGADLFELLRTEQPDLALAVSHGGQADLQAWMNGGLVDLAFTYWPLTHPRWQVLELPSDQLVLVSTDATSPIRFDPGYVYVESGDEFGREHAAAYADADTAKLSFGSAVLGLAHLLEHGGSAYAPLRLCQTALAEGQLHRLEAPTFTRRAYVIVDTAASEAWDWFPTWLESAVSSAQP